MLPLLVVIPFAIASLALTLAPGPDNLAVLAIASTHGRRDGLLLTLGLCCGLMIHTAAVALGIAAVIMASATAFTVIKLIGAAYLLFLAWQLCRTVETADTQPAPTRRAAWRLALRGLLMNVSNPKVAIFFLAFLPQFTDPTRGSVTLQILTLGGIFIAITTLVFGGIACMAAAIGARLRRSPRIRTIMQRLAAAVFAGLALRLAISRA